VLARVAAAARTVSIRPGTTQLTVMPLRREVERQRFGESGESRLRGDDVRAASRAPVTRIRRRCSRSSHRRFARDAERTRACRGTPRRGSPRARSPFGERHVAERLLRPDRRVVDEDVEPAEARDGRATSAAAASGSVTSAMWLAPREPVASISRTVSSTSACACSALTITSRRPTASAHAMRASDVARTSGDERHLAGELAPRGGIVRRHRKLRCLQAESRCGNAEQEAMQQHHDEGDGGPADDGHRVELAFRDEGP
jgi:hypothetical protein